MKLRNQLQRVERNGYIFFVDRSLRENRVCYFGGGKVKKQVAPLPDPVPTPESIDEQSLEAGDAEKRRLSRLKGRKSTILTPGGSLGASAKSRASLLGDVGVV